MNPLSQYDPYTGGQSLPSYDSRYQNDGLINALFRDLTKQQILGAFTPQGQGGQSSAFLDMLMNGLPQQSVTTPAPAQAPAASAAPAAVEEAVMMLPDGRNDGYDSGSLHGGDGYGLYGMAGDGEMVSGSSGGVSGK